MISGDFIAEEIDDIECLNQVQFDCDMQTTQNYPMVDINHVKGFIERRLKKVSFNNQILPPKPQMNKKQFTISEPVNVEIDLQTLKNENMSHTKAKALFRGKKSAQLVLDDMTIVNCASKDISPDISGSGKPLRARRIKKQKSIESPIEKTGPIFNFDQDEILSESLIDDEVTSPELGESGKLLRARRIKKQTSVDDTPRKNEHVQDADTGYTQLNTQAISNISGKESYLEFEKVNTSEENRENINDIGNYQENDSEKRIKKDDKQHVVNIHRQIKNDMDNKHICMNSDSQLSNSFRKLLLENEPEGIFEQVGCKNGNICDLMSMSSVVDKKSNLKTVNSKDLKIKLQNSFVPEMKCQVSPKEEKAHQYYVVNIQLNPESKDKMDLNLQHEILCEPDTSATISYLSETL